MGELPIIVAYWVGWLFFGPHNPVEPRKADLVLAAQTLANVQKVVSYTHLAQQSHIQPELWNTADDPPVNELREWPKADLNKAELCLLLNAKPLPEAITTWLNLQRNAERLGVCFLQNNLWKPTPGEWVDSTLSPRWLGPVAWLPPGIPTAPGYINLYWHIGEPKWMFNSGWRGSRSANDLISEPIDPKLLYWPKISLPASTTGKEPLETSSRHK